MIEEKIPELADSLMMYSDYEQVTCMVLHYSNILLFYGAMTILFLTTVIGFLLLALMRKK